MRANSLAAGLLFALMCGVAAASLPADWTWLFPIVGSPPVGNPQDRTIYRVPGSTQGHNDVEIHDLEHAVDWFPAEHPALPPIVANGHGGANACGFCHLPDGNGRPENSSLAGLPADYIKRQVVAFADGSRRSVLASAMPIKMMAATAKNATSTEIDQAAAYFAGLRYTSHLRVVETSAVGFRVARFVYELDPGAQQPVGERIIEVPVDPDRFDRRDPHVTYTAFVPIGAVAEGRALATSGGPTGQPCAMCHGAGLRGGMGPPLAGRSPTGIVRQLAAFQASTRSGPDAAPMQAVAAPLDAKMMIAIAAYAATLKP